jgi:hypothetical protein
LDEEHQRETLAFLRETLGLTVEGDLDPTGYTKMAQGALEKRLTAAPAASRPRSGSHSDA